jgi:hypothetical protein
MFNQFSQKRPFTPSAPTRQVSGQPAASSSGAGSSFGAQIRPDFMQRSPATGSGGGLQPSSRMQRIKPDNFQRMTPQGQRAALFDQARQQNKEAYQTNYQTLGNPGSALPGGLSEKQRMDFAMLQRTNPLAAQQQLQQYQRTADIRYNKPGTTPQPPAGSGLTYRRPPGGPTGPRRTFGA